eukprot:COSAG04_NODE_1049_length_8559_cov_2.876359_4_plen_283_part_00
MAREAAAERSRREAEAERAARRAEQQARAAREEELRSAEQRRQRQERQRRQEQQQQPPCADKSSSRLLMSASSLRLRVLCVGDRRPQEEGGASGMAAQYKATRRAMVRAQPSASSRLMGVLDLGILVDAAEIQAAGGVTWVRFEKTQPPVGIPGVNALQGWVAEKDAKGVVQLRLLRSATGDFASGGSAAGSGGGGSGGGSGPPPRETSTRQERRAHALGVLGFGPTDTPDLPTLKAAYRRCALKHHPDRRQNHDRQQEATLLFQEAKEAFDALARAAGRTR